MARALSIRTAPARRHTVKDEMLRQHVLDEIAFDTRFHGADIAVAVCEGIATLAGSVHGNALKQAAARAAEAVAGIRAVANDIKVGSTLHGARRDTRIAAMLANSLSWNATLGAQAVAARVERGWVILEGTMSSCFQRFEASCAVQALPGVRGVTNLIRVCSTPGASRAFVRACAQPTCAEEDEIDVRVSAKGLCGWVDSCDHRSHAEDAACHQGSEARARVSALSASQPSGC
jgi:osmotically-inducible protein OsmY